MTSIVDKYYRRIIQNIDNVKMKFDVSALLVKSKEHDSKINTNVSDISDNLSKIETNESNISDNLSKIETNESNISDNLSKIETNESNISDNLGKIETNESNISDNYNISQINKNKSEFNTSLCDTNRNNIASNLLLINELNNYYKIRHFIKFETVNNINRAININSPKFSIIKNDIVFDF